MSESVTSSSASAEQEGGEEQEKNIMERVTTLFGVEVGKRFEGKIQKQNTRAAG